MGLLDPARNHLADRALRDSFGSNEHRAAARRAVRASIVLLKNADGILPLAKTAKHIHVAGKAADDIGMQCGGWTITWQGSAGPVTTGTTIRAGIEGSVSKKTRVTYSDDGKGAQRADVAIVVVGESPYAEGVGDRSDLALSADDVAVVERVAETGTPMIVIVLSGRPLVLGSTLDRAAAVLAAWLPGTEGAGVADVLFGDYAPTGKLSHRWPASMADVPLGTRATSEALFPYGFGLVYERTG
jgi:beta-glucosidase